MSRAARRPAAFAALLAALLLTRDPHTATTLAESLGQAEPVPSACRVIAEVTLDRKLVCPLQPVAVRFRLQATCPTDRAELRVDALRLVSPFPEGIIAYEPVPGDPALPDGGTTPEPWRFELSERVPALTVATLWVRPLHPGAFDIGAADVEIVDSEGRRATAKSTPVRLLVAEGCQAARRSMAFLPALYSPACAPSSTPMDYALVLDRSTSIGAAGLEAELAATEDFIDQLVDGRDRVALVAFDDQARVVAPLGSTIAQTRAALDVLGQRRPQPGTRLDRAIAAGLAALEAGRGAVGRRAVLVLISDGVHFGPGGTEAVLQAAEQARALGVRIATIAVGAVIDRRFMARITTAPGQSHVAADGAAMASAFRSLADDAAITCTN